MNSNHCRETCQDRTAGRAMLCLVMLIALGTAGCSATNQRASAKAWTSLRVNTTATTETASGMVVNMIELVGLGIKGFLELPDRLESTEHPARE